MAQRKPHKYRFYKNELVNTVFEDMKVCFGTMKFKLIKATNSRILIQNSISFRSSYFRKNETPHRKRTGYHSTSRISLKCTPQGAGN
jgi:hypothetical protein